MSSEDGELVSSHATGNTPNRSKHNAPGTGIQKSIKTKVHIPIHFCYSALNYLLFKTLCAPLPILGLRLRLVVDIFSDLDLKRQEAYGCCEWRQLFSILQALKP